MSALAKVRELVAAVKGLRPSWAREDETDDEGNRSWPCACYPPRMMQGAHEESCRRLRAAVSAMEGERVIVAIDPDDLRTTFDVVAQEMADETAREFGAIHGEVTKMTLYLFTARVKRHLGIVER